MKSILRLVLIVAFTSLVPTVSPAQDSSSHAAAALRLAELMNIEKSIQQALDITIKAQLEGNPSLKPYEDIMRSFMAKYLSWENLKDKYIQIYTQEFTESELKAILEFYQTDVGQKAITKLPTLLARGGEIGQQAVRDHLPELQEAIANRAKELGQTK